MSVIIIGPPTTSPEAIEGHCPGEEGVWDRLGSNCYLFRPNEILTWEESKQACQKAGGSNNATLVSMESAQESRYIQALIHDRSMLPMHRNYWLGLKRKIFSMYKSNRHFSILFI